MFRRAMLTSTLRDLLGEHGPLADRVLEEVRADRGRLPVVFPGLPRRTARAPVGGGRREFGDALVDLDAFRVCDLVAAYLTTSINATADELIDVFLHGDIEERAMLLRSLTFLPLGDATQRLMGEVLRTNIVLHLEAALCDHNLLTRAIRAGAVDSATGNRLLLKFAFVDLPLCRASVDSSISTLLLLSLLAIKKSKAQNKNLKI